MSRRESNRSDDNEEGTYRMAGRRSVGVLVAYAVLVALILGVVGPRVQSGYTWALYVLVALTAFFLARYLSVRYVLTDTDLIARRILGGRRIPLEDIRGIERSSLRDLAPTGSVLGTGSVGWHGRMISPTLGEFDSVFTEAADGLLVTAGVCPLYISPRDPEAFARELSRRVRSYTGPLAKDVGSPQP